jgi:pimeloyl-ACP methyl ester carboxylesterase
VNSRRISVRAILAALFLAACTQAAADPTAEPTARATATETPDPLSRVTVDGRFAVDADGRRIAVRCWGQGPVIVLEGGGAGSLQFGQSAFTRELARHAQVCVHGRAGIGLSDAAPDRMRDADDVVEDLRDALSAAHVDPPYVLVGSSFGGFVMTYFAERYPDTVTGVVTLDTPAPSLDLTPENFPEGVWDHPQNVEHLDVVGGFENRFAEDPPTFGAPLIVVTAIGGQSSVEDQSFWLQSSPDSHQVELIGGHEIYEDDVDGVVAVVRGLILDAR